MGRKSRNKGAAGEREFANLLGEAIGRQLKRNLAQYQQSGDYDLHGLEWAAIEVKRHRTALDGQINAWWTETRDQAPTGLLPVLAYRGDRMAWRVVIPLQFIVALNIQTHDHLPATLTIDGFARVVSEYEALHGTGTAGQPLT